MVPIFWATLYSVPQPVTSYGEGQPVRYLEMGNDDFGDINGCEFMTATQLCASSVT